MSENRCLPISERTCRICIRPSDSVFSLSVWSSNLTGFHLLFMRITLNIAPTNAVRKMNSIGHVGCCMKARDTFINALIRILQPEKFCNIYHTAQCDSLIVARAMVHLWHTFAHLWHAFGTPVSTLFSFICNVNYRQQIYRSVKLLTLYYERR